MRKTTISSILLITFLLCSLAYADQVPKSKGQTVFVASWHNLGGTVGNVEQRNTGVLCIRNTDPDNPIVISSIGFYDPEGNFVKDVLEQSGPVTLAPFATTMYGTYALGVPLFTVAGFPNFVVEWCSEKKVNVPHIGAGLCIVNHDLVLNTFTTISISLFGSEVIKEGKSQRCPPLH